jgi:hypothetical protein
VFSRCSWTSPVSYFVKKKQTYSIVAETTKIVVIKRSGKREFVFAGYSKDFA